MPNTLYELWSVPSFANDEPELSLGKDIRSTKLRVRPDDVLICKINPRINRVWRVRRPVDGLDQVASGEWLVFRIHPDVGLLPSWLIHFVSAPAFREWIVSEVSGATGSHTRAKAAGILRQSIPIPPVPEQQRIVGILEEAFAAMSTARENAQKNLRNARAIFESHLDSVFSWPAEGWVERRLEQAAAATCTLSYGIVQPGEECANGLPVVRPTDLTTKVIPVSGLKRIDPKRADAYGRTSLQGGELLLCVRGSTGVVAVASAELAGANVTRGIVPIRFDAAALSQDFGYYLLSSGAVQRQVREKTYGAALMQVNIRDLRNITVSFPPLSEQETIVARLDELSSEAKRLESIYQHRLAAIDELKKSLLHQAFTGQLGSHAA